MQRIDLNLFRVFDAVMRTRSVSGAGRELGITASAVSHALARLRQALRDELFIAGEQGMAPTARALELAPGIADGLRRIAGAVTVRPFIPAETSRTFRIAASDFIAVALLPATIARIIRAAPQLKLRILPFDRCEVIRNLDDGRIDVALGWFGDLPERLRRTAVGWDHETIVVRPGHPLTREPATRARLLDFPHIIIERTGTAAETNDNVPGDRGVGRRGRTEPLPIETDCDSDLGGRAAIFVPHFTAVPPLLAVTEMIATLPDSLARRGAAEGTLAILDLPYAPRAVPIEAVWHQRADGNAAIPWLVGEFVKAMPAAGSAAGPD
ncbi:MAG: LysR family transcriptional regulator [Azospirillaceae bacterium]|nr:LysR family transcriptional regulator [Azospirillaceae bacterium]